MNEKITPEKVKDFLQKYSDDARNLAAMKERLSALDAKTGVPRTSALDGLPHGSSTQTDTIGRQVAALDTLRAAVESAEAQLAQRRQRTEAVIYLLKDHRVLRWPEMVNTLSLRYIDGLPWNDAAEVLFGSLPDYWDAPERYRARMLKYQRDAFAALATLVEPSALDDYDE